MQDLLKLTEHCCAFLREGGPGTIRNAVEALPIDVAPTSSHACTAPTGDQSFMPSRKSTHKERAAAEQHEAVNSRTSIADQTSNPTITDTANTIRLSDRLAITPYQPRSPDHTSSDVR